MKKSKKKHRKNRNAIEEKRRDVDKPDNQHNWDAIRFDPKWTSLAFCFLALSLHAFVGPELARTMDDRSFWLAVVALLAFIVWMVLRRMESFRLKRIDIGATHGQSALWLKTETQSDPTQRNEADE